MSELYLSVIWNLMVSTDTKVGQISVKVLCENQLALSIYSNEYCIFRPSLPFPLPVSSSPFSTSASLLLSSP